DPLLPPELLPSPWAGAAARELAARCWALLERQELADGDAKARPRLFRLYDDVVREAADRAS
ncbi:MAG TPA: PaaX family transcriptional regulator C-terminal domain-containing protein, partial [Streptomyces sp.]|nr:PaaX family transcriptional regulator C-terminal domain-containing protein [Streptomyces sp.]